MARIYAADAVRSRLAATFPPFRHPRAEQERSDVAETLGSMPYPRGSAPAVQDRTAKCAPNAVLQRRHRPDDHGMDPRVKPEDDEAEGDTQQNTSVGD
jgi:hypothetical protein